MDVLPVREHASRYSVVRDISDRETYRYTDIQTYYFHN